MSGMTPNLILKHVTLVGQPDAPGEPIDIRIQDGVIAEIGPNLTADDVTSDKVTGDNVVTRRRR